jgi:hypothetical protein
MRTKRPRQSFEEKKRFMGNKGASLTLFISIWTGLIIAGILLYPEKYMGPGSISDAVVTAYTQSQQGNFLGAIMTIIQNGFTSPNAALILGLMLVGGFFAGGLMSVATGGGFSLLFAIPTLLIVAVLGFYVLPITQIMADTSCAATSSAVPTPCPVQLIFILIFGGLTLLTVWTFIAGRN